MEENNMYQRFRNVAATALALGFATSVSCSAPKEDDDDDPFGATAGSVTASGSNTGTGGAASGASGGSTSSTTGSAQGASNTSDGNVQVAVSTTGSATSGASTTGSGTPSIGDDLGVACPGIELSEDANTDDACVGTGYEAEALPVDLVLMVDTSTSMVDNEVNGVTRWDLVSQAVKDFVNDPDAEGIGMGIQFFSWLNDASCDIDNYSTPAVPIAPVEENGAEISAEIDAQVPGGLTPTFPALSGAIQYAKSHAADNPARQTVVVFVSDGFPTRCEPMDIPQIAALAEDSWANDPKVPVFVVGIDGTHNLEQIARSGGTREAFNVENDGNTTRLVSALKNITTDSARCEFEIPVPPNSDFQSVDTDLVQVVYTPGSGNQQEIPKVSGYSACGQSPNGGWYFGGSDANGRPTRVIVCPCSCANFGAGSVEVALGCEPTPFVE
jgi:Mg-chelatase subunit ChlD